LVFYALVQKACHDPRRKKKEKKQKKRAPVVARAEVEYLLGLELVAYQSMPILMSPIASHYRVQNLIIVC
jgi:hypothetical protein